MKNELDISKLNEPTPRSSRILILRQVQSEHFADVINYFADPLNNKDVPLVTQLNLTIDTDGLIRVKCKMEKLNAPYELKYPILLPKKSLFTRNMVSSIHMSIKHAGIYKVLNVIRKEFWIPSAYSVVKSVLNCCLICKRLHGRPVNFNQNSYKDYHINASDIPFRRIALDHIGPFVVKNDHNENIKVYILILTCLYTRAVNLLLCKYINTECFLNAFQLHVLEHGIPEIVISDNGSPLTSSFPIICNFLSSHEVKEYLNSRNIKFLEHLPYPANASFLGGIVESLVKQVKIMINVSIGRNIITCDQFYYLMKECTILVNKRPIACERNLSNSSSDYFNVISPEKLLKGFDIPSIVIAPHLHFEDLPKDDSIWSDDMNTLNEKLIKSYKQLQNIRCKLSRNYFDEFLQNMRDQSSSKPGQYKNKNPVNISVNDLIAVKQQFTKPFSYPIGLVTDIERNSLNEIVAVSLRKTNGEIIRRHISDVILLESNSLSTETINNMESSSFQMIKNKRRAAAKHCSDKNSSLFKQGVL